MKARLFERKCNSSKFCDTFFLSTVLRCHWHIINWRLKVYNLLHFHTYIPANPVIFVSEKQPSLTSWAPQCWVLSALWRVKKATLDRHVSSYCVYLINNLRNLRTQKFYFTFLTKMITMNIYIYIELFYISYIKEILFKSQYTFSGNIIYALKKETTEQWQTRNSINIQKLSYTPGIKYKKYIF